MQLPSTWKSRGQKNHLVTEFADGDTTLVVYKFWLRRKQRGSYVTEERWLVEYELGLISKQS